MSCKALFSFHWLFFFLFNRPLVLLPLPFADYPCYLSLSLFFSCLFKCQHLQAFHKCTFVLTTWGWCVNLHDKRWVTIGAIPSFLRAACMGSKWGEPMTRQNKQGSKKDSCLIPVFFKYKPTCTCTYVHLLCFCLLQKHQWSTCPFDNWCCPMQGCCLNNLCSDGWLM